MRKLAWAAAAFAAAIFLAEYLLPVKGLPYLSAALFLVCPLGLLWKGKNRKRVILVCVSAALGLGVFFLHHQLRTAPCQALAGEQLELAAYVTDYPIVTERYSCVEVRLQEPELPPVKATFYLYNDTMPALTPGDRVQLTVQIAGEATDAADSNRFLLGYMTEAPVVTGRWAWSWTLFPARMAHGLKSACAEVFPDFASPFVTAIMTGDTRALKADGGAYTELRIAGVAHAVAVSGMHLSYVVAFVQLFLGRGRRASLWGLPVIVVFILMTGATPSVMRAGIMQGMLLLAPLFDRERDGVTALAAALALLLLLNPRAAGSLSLQLSFAAAAGLELMMPTVLRWQARKRWILSRALGILGCTLGASIFTAPLTAYYFGMIPLLAPLANLLTLPLLSVIFICGYAVSALGLLWPLGASVLAWLPGALVWYCRKVYALLAGIPNACLYTQSRAVVLWLILVYGLFALFYLLRDRKRRFRPLLPACLSVMALCLMLLGTRLFGSMGRSLTALDMGQGACSVLMDKTAAVVVDCGGSGFDNAGDTAANFLLSRAQRDVDVLILTHLHADHADGAKTLIRRMPVRLLVLPGDAEDEDALLSEILTAAEECGTQILYLPSETELQVGDMELLLCQPLAGTGENERGIALRAELGEQSVVITGDLDTEGEMALVSLGLANTPADILLVGHHGSAGSSSHFFLNALRPDCAIISVGDNSYGHPAAPALERLFAYCDQIRRTDLEGNITIRID